MKQTHSNILFRPFRWMIFYSILAVCFVSNPVMSDSLESQLQSESTTFVYLTSYQINENYDDSTFDIINKFEDLVFIFRGDTAVQVGNIDEEELYSGTLEPRKYFERNYVLSFYQNSLLAKLNLELPETINYVRNKNYHSYESILHNLFDQGFFIDDEFISRTNAM